MYCSAPLRFSRPRAAAKSMSQINWSRTSQLALHELQFARSFFSRDFLSKRKASQNCFTVKRNVFHLQTRHAACSCTLNFQRTTFCRYFKEDINQMRQLSTASMRTYNVFSECSNTKCRNCIPVALALRGTSFWSKAKNSAANLTGSPAYPRSETLEHLPVSSHTRSPERSSLEKEQVISSFPSEHWTPRFFSFRGITDANRKVDGEGDNNIAASSAHNVSGGEVSSQSAGASQLKIAEAEKTVQQVDALSRAPIQNKKPRTSFFKNIRSFCAGFFLASGCGFYVMYCEVGEATLALQLTAKDATHRLAVLESRLQNLEQRLDSHELNVEPKT